MTDKDGADPLLDSLRELHQRRASTFQSEWQRAVSFGDEIVDRWEKAKALGFGEGSSIYDSALVLGDVRVGARTWIGPGTILDGSGGLEIGDNCSISAGVQIYSHDTVKWAVSGGAASVERAPVVVGNNTFIGPLSVVGKGVRIGKSCVIGAHSFVNADLPDYSVAFGSPCRRVGTVTVDGDKVEITYDAKREGQTERG